MLSPNGSDPYAESLPRQSLSIPVMQAAQVGDARRQATTLAQKLGFSETDRGKISLAVTEAANNLVKHGNGGEILLLPTPLQKQPSLDILALDKGPGMASVAKCLTDGYSTSGTPGTGLGAIQRLSSILDIHSLKAQGTVLFARFEEEEKKRRREEEKTEDRRQKTEESQSSIVNRQSSIHSSLITHHSSFPLGVASVSAPGETVCGDDWEVQVRGERIYVLMADGLGHGPQAAEAAQEATRIFRGCAGHEDSQTLLQDIHAALRSTRGAAAAIAILDTGRRQVAFTGIGNIAGSIVSGNDSHSLVSLSGIVGHQMRRVQTFTYACPPGALLILHSDGLTTQWRLDRYVGLTQRAPAVIAGVLYRDCKRGRDDASVLVAQSPKSAQA